AADRPGLLRETLGELARVHAGLGAAAGPGLRRQLPGQWLLPDLVRRRRPPAAPAGGGRPALRLRRVDPDLLALAPGGLPRRQRLRPGDPRGRRGPDGDGRHADPALPRPPGPDGAGVP